MGKILSDYVEHSTGRGIVILRQPAFTLKDTSDIHLRNTQLYPLCREAFITTSEKGIRSLVLTFEDCHAPETDAIGKAFTGVPHKKEREDNHSTLKISFTGEVNIYMTA